MREGRERERDTMPGKKKKQKLIKWSKLYTFSCLRPTADESSPADQLLGQPGFSRVVFCNEPHLHRSSPYKYSSNYVSTTKYNVVTFLPIALFEQFRRVANLYFLLAAILSLTPLAAFNRVSVVAPLVFVIGMSMIKEAIEDWHRFLQDRKVNSRKVMVHAGDGLFVKKSWESLMVGDVVKVSKNEYFPGDLLLLCSSFEDGLCYVETMNLDGETNLKAKRSLEATLSLDEESAFCKFKASIRCEDPNPSLYTFVGNLDYNEGSYPLTPSQILLRDSKLRNTEYVYGAVVFSGADTKAVKNSTRSPSKRSRVEKKMDSVIYLLFGMMVFISLVTAIGSVMFAESSDGRRWYLRLDDSDDELFDPNEPALSSFLQFVKALMLYGYLIPISLYVSIEVVKVLQAMMINNDLAMYDEATGKAVEARTSNLNEELGQAEMIFSDKTGTLTCNQMEFRKCSIEGISFGGEVTEVDLAASRRMNIDVERHRFSLDGSDSTARSIEMFDLSTADGSAEKEGLGLNENEGVAKGRDSRISISDKERMIKGFNFRDGRLTDKMWIYRSNVGEMVMFFRVMALCHTGIPVEEKTAYEAESPEEVAFLIAAREFGFKFCQRTQSTMVVQELDPMSGLEVMREYKLLNLLEFNSSRKRMSVIVCNEDGEIFLFCKGADEVIFDRLADGGRTYQQATVMHLSNYAEDGLRTMVFAYRRISVSEYESWSSVFAKAKENVCPERDELLENASDMIEKDLILLGAVAVEDKLQRGVPECIDKLSQAGLKIWLLTGDKKETAVNIGFACSLLRHDMEQLHLSTSKELRMKDIKEEIKSQLQSLNQLITEEEERKEAPFALVVDGKVLELCLGNDMSRQFLCVAMKCDVVICCRVSPKQKALITRRVKEYSGKTILAIGDGANDVGMIQEADIGVGISGSEGMQAVMASDFSLPEFRFLERLLIIHGHWCYRRISKMILYFVYKNVAFGLTMFYYNIFTGFSGQNLYDDWYMVVFNVLLTSLPVISIGVLEQDVSSDVCFKFPALYQQGQKNTCFSWKRIIGWIANAILTSLIVFTLTICILSPSTFDEYGSPADIEHVGTITYTCIIWTVNCQMALMISHFTWISHFLIWGSILCWYLFLYLYSSVSPAYSGDVFHVLLDQLGGAPLYWITTLFVVVVSLLPYFVHVVVQRSFYPIDDFIIQEMKQSKTDVMDSPMWLREQEKSKQLTQVGYSARVDAKIRHLKEQLRKKRKSFYLSVTNSRQ